MAAVKARLVVVAALLLGCQSPVPGRDTPDWVGSGESGSFVVHLFLTDDFERTVREWNVPGTPKLHPVSSIALGKPVSTAFLLSGCEPGPRHECDVVFDFEVIDANAG